MALDDIDDLPDNPASGQSGHRQAHQKIHSGLKSVKDLIDAPAEIVARALGWAIATDEQWAGGAKTDGTNVATAINAALAAANIVYVPEGSYTLTSSINITGANGKNLIGADRNKTKFIVTNSVSTAALLGTSSGTQDFSMSGFTIDCTWTTGRTSIPAVQITNGARILIENIGVKDAGGAGILLQGLNADGGTPDSTVRRCVINGTGLSDGTTGFGIWFKDKSARGLIEQNRVTNVKGGMGIGLGGSVGTGYPTMCRILNNHIQMVQSNTGFEAIGITAGCTNAIVANNIIKDTFDNGISASSDFCTVIGNNVDGTWNHGIYAAGRGTQIVGNYVRNVGKENPALGFGGICLETTSWATVVGNTVEDDQETHTTAYGVKLNSSGGNNRIGPNSFHGWLTAPYLGLLSTDLVIDAETKTDGYSFTKLYADSINAKTTNGTVSMQSAFNPTNFNVIGSGAAKNAQLTVFSNAGATRANQALSVATGQVAPVLKVLNPSDVTLSEITKDGVFKTLAVATGSRPSASTVGAGGMIFDTTLAKPIWSDGTNWKDATGTTV